MSTILNRFHLHSTTNPSHIFWVFCNFLSSTIYMPQIAIHKCLSPLAIFINFALPDTNIRKYYQCAKLTYHSCSTCHPHAVTVLLAAILQLFHDEEQNDSWIVLTKSIGFSYAYKYHIYFFTNPPPPTYLALPVFSIFFLCAAH